MLGGELLAALPVVGCLLGESKAKSGETVPHFSDTYKPAEKAEVKKPRDPFSGIKEIPPSPLLAQEEIGAITMNAGGDQGARRYGGTTIHFLCFISEETYHNSGLAFYALNLTMIRR